jgi:hypothetical protein
MSAMRLSLSFVPVLLLALACCFGGSMPTSTAEVRGSVRDIHGAPVAGAHVVLMANDGASCPDCSGARTQVTTTSGADGSFVVSNGSFMPEGYEGIVDVERTVDDYTSVLASHRFRPPAFGPPTVIDVTLYVDERDDLGPLGVDHSTFLPEDGFRFVRDDSAAAYVLCSPRALHACTGASGDGDAERRWLAFDIDATPSCDTQLADARTRCGSGTDDATYACLSRAGLFLDARGLPIVPSPGPVFESIHVRCDEGHADPMQFAPPSDEGP